MHPGKALRTADGGVELDIMVSPRSGASRIEGFDQWRNRVTVKVRAPPADGRANREIVELFRDVTGADVRIVHGSTSRLKTLHIGIEPSRLLDTLEGYG